MNLSFILFLISTIGFIIISILNTNLYLSAYNSLFNRSPIPHLSKNVWNWIELIIVVCIYFICLIVLLIMSTIDRALLIEVENYMENEIDSIDYDVGSYHFDIFDNYDLESDNYYWDSYDWHQNLQAIANNDKYIASLDCLSHLYENEEFMTMQRNIENFYLNRNTVFKGSQAVIFLNDFLLDSIANDNTSNINDIIDSLHTSSSTSTNFTDIVNQMRDGADVNIYSPSYPQGHSEVIQAEMDAMDNYYERILKNNDAIHDNIIKTFKENYTPIRPVVIYTTPVSEPQPLPSWTSVFANSSDYAIREKNLNRIIESETHRG